MILRNLSNVLFLKFNTTAVFGKVFVVDTGFSSDDALGETQQPVRDWFAEARSLAMESMQQVLAAWKRSLQWTQLCLGKVNLNAIF